MQTFRTGVLPRSPVGILEVTPVKVDDTLYLCDPVNKLFLVAEQSYCGGGQGSAIVIYDEAGNLVNTITGFDFVGAEPAPVLNPSKRMGWAFSGKKGFNQLQQFFY